MNTKSASPAEPADAAPAARAILVWDAPVRVFHWLAVLSFAGAWVTAESERWRMVHVTLGYTLAGLVVFRLVWGFVGSRHARFASFVRGPAAVRDYLRGLVRGRPEHHVGHNPAGAWAIVALLTLAGAVTAAGWATFNEIGGERIKHLHEAAAHAMLILVGVHVAGVLLGSWMHRDNLVGAMFSGRKRGLPDDGVRSAWRGVAAVMLVAVLGFWTLQWQSAPAASGGAATAQATRHHGDDDD